MREKTIASAFRTNVRFVRSVHLERDFRDPHALDGFVLVPAVRSAIERVVTGLRPTSRQRAWRITGDYGAGKSLFGLALARLLGGGKGLPSELSKAIDFRQLGFKRLPAMFPLLITGAREGLASALGRGVATAVQALKADNRPSKALGVLSKAAARACESDANALAALGALIEFLVATSRADGVLLVLDEMGKLLEFAALHPDRSDVYLLQQLAESATRSAGRPLVVVGMLHQGFRAYAEPLSNAAQQEWAKVASRYEEVLFDQPLEHVAALGARALNVSLPALGEPIAAAAVKASKRTLKLGWYGAASERTPPGQAVQLYPLHPSVLPVAVRFLRRFGQNERSLFGFLLSDEPFGLQAFASRAISPETWYRLSDFYDYVRGSWGHALGGRSYQAQWLRIVEIVDGARDLPELQRTTLKAIGLLNVLDADDLRATQESIAVALSADAVLLAAAIQALRDRHLLFDRGTAGGLCLWPHTSVDLETARAAAERALGPITQVAPVLASQLDATPIVARRHYVERGTLRHFEVRFVAGAAAADSLQQPPRGDGLILVLLSDTTAEHTAAIAFAQSPPMADRPEVLVAVPEPVSGLGGLVRDVGCWQWVLQNTPELNHDRFAAGEVARQLAAARRALTERSDRIIGLSSASGALGLQWFHRSAMERLSGARELLARLSGVCDEIYPLAPHVTNELLNRRTLSSAAARARMALIDALLERSREPSLGLPTEKAPPERAVYLSVLRRGNIHRRGSRGYEISVPPERSDPLHLRPALGRIGELLAAAGDRQTSVENLLIALRSAPYGVRDGLIPLLLAIYAKAHEHELAFYEDGGLLMRLGVHEFQRLVKAPATFSVQLCKVVGVRAEVFDQIVELLDVPRPDGRAPVMLDVVTPLLQFAAQLPQYAARTARLSPHARAVRDALTRAEEPGPLLFALLPAACGQAPFEAINPIERDRVVAFVGALRTALDELRSAYPELLRRIAKTLVVTLNAPSESNDMRPDLARRAAQVLLTVREPRLRGFCLRLTDAHLGPDLWTESVASFVKEKPPSRWSDADENAFAEAAATLADTFRRVETIGFSRDGNSDGAALRIVLTNANGEERGEVVRFSAAEEREVAVLAAKVAALLGTGGRIQLAAATRAVWQALNGAGGQSAESGRVSTITLSAGGDAS